MDGRWVVSLAPFSSSFIFFPLFSPLFPPVLFGWVPLFPLLFLLTFLA